MFSVEWSEDATPELAALWLSIESEARASVTAACHQADRRLLTDPLGEGESRPHGQRILFVAPLALIYRLEGDEQSVTILHTHFFRRRR